MTNWETNAMQKNDLFLFLATQFPQTGSFIFDSFVFLWFEESAEPLFSICLKIHSYIIFFTVSLNICQECWNCQGLASRLLILL